MHGEPLDWHTNSRIATDRANHRACHIVSADHNVRIPIACASLRVWNKRRMRDAADAADAGMQQRIVTFVGGACVLKFCLPNMRSTCQECGAGEGHMNDLFGRLVADIGVDRTAPADVCRLPSAITEGRAARNGAGRYPTYPRRRRDDASARSAFESGGHVGSAR